MTTPSQDAVDREAAKVETLNAQLQALSAEAIAKRTALREAYRDQHATRYANFDVKQALLGMPVEYALQLGSLSTYYLRAPTGAIRQSIDAYLQTAGKDVQPITASEITALAWVTAVYAQGAPARRELATVDLVDRLRLFRVLPALLLDRVAAECSTLESYLSVVLEIELGNS